jgi:hypothetical protein
MYHRDYLVKVYEDWRNNYVTVGTFAEHHGLTEEQGRKLLELAREVYYSAHPDA